VRLIHSPGVTGGMQRMTSTNSHTIISDIAREHLRLHLTPDLGPIRVRSLLEHFGSAEAIFSASQAELRHVERIGPKVAESIFHFRDEDLVDAEIDRASECGVQILCCEDERYPAPLRRIPDPPTCLYVKGTLQHTDAVSIAIVGTRRCSRYGAEQAARFGELLGGTGFTVVSGLARGIDGEAHRGALSAGGRTIAAMGHGLGMVYPPEHRELAERIAGEKNGALVSSLPMDMGPDAKNFPPRNRIIAGLSLGTVVIEAGKRSGALITARLATEYDREVFAMPGRIDQVQHSAGTNGLIRDGKAKLITCLDDVLDELLEVGEIMRSYSADDNDGKRAGDDEPSVPVHLLPNEQAVFAAVKSGEEDVDSIVQASGLNVARVTSLLTTLQLKGLVRRLPGNRFELRGKGEMG